MQLYSEFITSVLTKSGALVHDSYGDILEVTQKKDSSQVVTAVDITSEKIITDHILNIFPEHSIIAEESGFLDKKSEYTWIVDPIDGTSNFAQGLPWFGVMIALLHNSTPIASGIYLPVTNQLYTAEKGEGIVVNGRKISSVAEKPLQQSLVSFCPDSHSDELQRKFLANIFYRLLPVVRNIRTTNSAVDYAYTAVGKLGGLISFGSKIWDVTPVALLATEAGQIVTDAYGETLQFALDSSSLTQEYSFVIAPPKVHAVLIEIISEARNSS